MCINPVKLANGQMVACRVCWQCVKRKVQDWAGRCVAESRVSVASHSVTLTYGRDERRSPDHVRAVMLCYADVQAYFKRLRSNLPDLVPGHEAGGYPVRFFCVGEYGSMKGRAHWHIVLFWKKRVPPGIELYKRYVEPHWPHGWSYFKPAEYSHVMYACEYITKKVGADGEAQQVHVGMSRHPPLGDGYFRQLAEMYAKHGLAPQDFSYRFAEVVDRHGKPIEFRMRGKTASNFVQHYEAAWKRLHGDAHMPNSQLVEEELDRQLPVDAERAKRALDEFQLSSRFQGALAPPQPCVSDPADLRFGQDGIRDWMDPDCVGFSDSVHAWYYSFADSGQAPWWWCRDVEGRLGWHEKIGAKGVVPMDRRPAAAAYRAATKGR